MKELKDYKKFKSDAEFARFLGVSTQNLSAWYSRNTYDANKISQVFPEVEPVWILTGMGNMLKSSAYTPINRHTIPFYDDVISLERDSNMVAEGSAPYFQYEHIDTGDWFHNATAAIRHYGDSMIEYPSGCILALKEVEDRNLIIPGRVYMIETSEYRVTKRIQRGADKDHIIAYSTNLEKYEDGRLIHEPFEIPWSAVTRISLVLGYVVKENGGTTVFNKK